MLLLSTTVAAEVVVTPFDCVVGRLAVAVAGMAPCCRPLAAGALLDSNPEAGKGREPCWFRIGCVVTPALLGRPTAAAAPRRPFCTLTWFKGTG